jgi:peptidoglycan/xylan/chitin deacetylase (PgdA/CDA1 family)
LGVRGLSERSKADRRSGDEILVLCYHAISERWPAAVAVTPVALERQLRGFLEAGFRGVTFSEAVHGSGGGKRLAVTFDDSYRSMFEHAYPVLSRLGVPGTAFIPTEHGGDGSPRSWGSITRWLGGDWERELAGASWEQLKQLAAAGWEIGSHSRTHVRLPELDDPALAEELEGSRADCEERVGIPCNSIAYPYGDHDGRVVEAARAAGYTAGATVSGLLDAAGVQADPLRCPRLGITRSDGTLRLLTKTRLYRHPRAWNLLQRVRGGRRVPPAA